MTETLFPDCLENWPYLVLDIDIFMWRTSLFETLITDPSYNCQMPLCVLIDFLIHTAHAFPFMYFSIQTRRNINLNISTLKFSVKSVSNILICYYFLFFIFYSLAKFFCLFLFQYHIFHQIQSRSLIWILQISSEYRFIYS